VGEIRYGPSGLPSRESPEAAVEILVERGYTACEIDFASGFWMKDEYAWATRLGDLACKAGIALSIHAPIAAFMGHVERDQKHRRATGMLDHSAGVAVACGAELVVFHPGFLLGRTREEALDSVLEQLAELRERLEAKGRNVSFGIEIMGRVRELGTAEDVFAVATRLPWIRPVIDFAHLHAVTDGAFVDAEALTGILKLADSVIEPGAPFHIHFSDIAFASHRLESGERGGNETRHLPYGEGTLRAEPLRDALSRFDRPATVISESPDEKSHQEIKAILTGPQAKAR
jgi:deoxyribonuclease IV